MPMLSDRSRLKMILSKIPVEDGRYICSIMYKDPFRDVYKTLLLIFVFILLGFLLWPFDFVFIIKNNTRWVKDPMGIEFLGTGQVLSTSSTRPFFERLTNGTGLTLEMWLQTEDLEQTGPARIFSYSINPYLRNFTLGQNEEQLIVRLRTTETDLNGMVPHLIVDNTFNSKSLQHIVVTYDFKRQTAYIDGQLKVRDGIPKGDFSNWDPSCSLVIGNEATGDRPWKGKIYYAAVFNRPLTEGEIYQHYLSGFSLKSDKEIKTVNTFEKEGPIARYLFDEGKGNVIHDSASSFHPANLDIPKYVSLERKPFLGIFMGSFSDIIINILIFIPLGILIHGMLRTRFGMSTKISVIALLFGALFTLSVESVQYFSITRYSTIIDVFNNLIGVSLGIAADRLYILYLNYQADRLQHFIYE